jgi:hypothetical protein
MQGRCFPATASLSMKGMCLTDEALQAVSGCTALTSLDPRGCPTVTAVGVLPHAQHHRRP